MHFAAASSLRAPQAVNKSILDQMNAHKQHQHVCMPPRNTTHSTPPPQDPFGAKRLRRIVAAYATSKQSSNCPN